MIEPAASLRLADEPTGNLDSPTPPAPGEAPEARRLPSASTAAMRAGLSSAMGGLPQLVRSPMSTTSSALAPASSCATAQAQTPAGRGVPESSSAPGIHGRTPGRVVEVIIERLVIRPPGRRTGARLAAPSVELADYLQARRRGR
ncbi:MAG TPA: hypothetical protein VG963_16955 [Polyangiaceae bacterium]|nr:hypothetical protein [Polyangiaceae bacterium]